MKKFNLREYSNHQKNYQVHILDIWCQNNQITAYVKGTNIYQTKLNIRNNRIANYYCSCPSSQGGMNFCKHLVGVENYIIDHKILELEFKEKKEELDFNLSKEKILTNFKLGINKYLDDDDCVNCYQSEYFCDYVFKYCIYIDKFLDNKEPLKAFYLITNYIDFINSIYIYVVDDLDDINEVLINYLETLAIDYNFCDKIKEYLETKYSNKELDSLGEAIMDKIR